MRIPAVKSSSIKDITSPKSMATKNMDHYTPTVAAEKFST